MTTTCGNWFSRSIELRADGTEGMAYICNDCGGEVTGAHDESEAEKGEGLKACWVCKARKSHVSKKCNDFWLIYCNSCGDNDAEVMRHTKLEAEQAWNNRAGGVG